MSDEKWTGPMPEWVLCQDCLAVLSFSVARHQEAELCTCGGQLCGCPSCEAEAKQRIAWGAVPLAVCERRQ